MGSTIAAFVIPLSIVLLAEMGDKTQLITIGLSTKYGVKKVITGIFISAAIVNMIAASTGNILARFGSLQTIIQTVAAISFIAFGLWTLKYDGTETKTKRNTLRNPVASIAATFFLAELGDKTQLTTLALSTRFPKYPHMVFLGATLGMVAADCIGIFAGAAMGKTLPERKIKLFSAIIFIVFGVFGLYQVILDKMNYLL